MSPALVGSLALAVAVAGSILSLVRTAPAGPSRRRHPDQIALAEAGMPWGLVRWEALRGALVLASAILLLAGDLPLGAVVLAAAAPSVWVRLRAAAARERARRAMTRLIAGTEAALRSGVTLPEAIRRAADAGTEPLTRDVLRSALRAFDLGAGLDAALRSAAADLGDRRMVLVLETLALAAEERLASGRAADLLAGLADRLIFEDRLSDEVRARASGARQQQKLLALLVPAIAFLLIASMPSLAAALDSDLGRFMLIPGAVVFEVAGIVMARRIVSEAVA